MTGRASRLLLTAGMVSIAAALPSVAGAAVLTVTTTDDLAACSGTLSLRCAVIAANAGSGGDTIKVPAGTYNLSIAGTFEQEAATGDLDVRKPVTIDGAGPGSTTIVGDGTDRVFDAGSNGDDGPDGTMTLSDLTVTGGPGDEPAIVYLNSSVALDRVVVRDNAAEGMSGTPGASHTVTIADSRFTANHLAGAGVHGTGSATITDSTFEGTIGGPGASVDVDVRISGSTFSGNGGSDTPLGGGLSFSGAHNEIVNSTFTDNHAQTGGGLFWHNFSHDPNTTLLRNVTITANTASSDGTGGGNSGGGGYFSYPARPNNVTTSENSIVSGNVMAYDGTSGTANNCQVLLTDGGGNVENGTSCGFSGASFDPELAALADNGGRTKTHALMPTSDAIDYGDNAKCAATDQRLAPRPFDGDDVAGAVCDSGAFEFGSTAPPVVDDDDDPGPGGDGGGGDPTPPPGGSPPPATQPPLVLPPGGAGPAQRTAGAILRTRTIRLPDGSVIVIVTCDGPGTVTAAAAGTGGARRRAVAAAKRKPAFRRVRKTVRAAGKVRLKLVPSRAAKKVIKRKGKLRVRVRLTFKPATGAADRKTITATFVRPKRRQ
jgi:hypothetical protein